MATPPTSGCCVSVSNTFAPGIARNPSADLECLQGLRLFAVVQNVLEYSIFKDTVHAIPCTKERILGDAFFLHFPSTRPWYTSKIFVRPGSSTPSPCVSPVTPSSLLLLNSLLSRVCGAPKERSILSSADPMADARCCSPLRSTTLSTSIHEWPGRNHVSPFSVLKSPCVAPEYHALMRVCVKTVARDVYCASMLPIQTMLLFRCASNRP